MSARRNDGGLSVTSLFTPCRPSSPAARLLMAGALFLTLAACSSAPPHRVTLLPDANGRIGQVLVSSTPRDGQAARSQALDQGYTEAVVGADGRIEVAKVDAASFDASHRELLQTLPLPAYSAVLYFVSGGTELTPASREALKDLKLRIRERAPTEVSIIGHTDTMGSDAVNDRLALERARTVDRLIREELGDIGPTQVRSFGARELLVPTGPQVDEARNRRVEIFVL